MINHLFARPQDVEGSAFHLDLLRELEPAGDYTVEFRRMDSLWHTRSERPRPSSDTLLIWHYGTSPPLHHHHGLRPRHRLGALLRNIQRRTLGLPLRPSTL